MWYNEKYQKLFDCGQAYEPSLRLDPLPG
jgi:hypothetical protein